MAEVGVGFVRLLPSMKGFSAAASKGLTAGLQAPAKAAGAAAGAEMSTGITGGLSKSRGAFKSSVAKIGSIFTSGLQLAGVAAGVAMAAGINSALQQEVATDKLEAQLGGGEFAGEMGEIAGRLYRDAFGDSLGEVGAGLRKVLQSGLLPEDATNEQIESMTARALTFTDVLDQDMGMAAQAVGKILRTGLAADGEEAFDVLTRGIQKGGDGAGDLLETFQEYSTIFRSIGLDAGDATGLMVQGLQAGARDADTVADALKEVAIRGKDGSEASAEGFRLLGLNAEEMTAKFAEGGDTAKKALDQVLTSLQATEDPFARNAAAVALFGTKSEDLQAALLALDVDAAADQLGEISGATDGLGSAYDNASTKITSFKRKALDKLVVFLGGVVIPAIERLIEVLGPPIQTVLAAVEGLINRIDFKQLAAAWLSFSDALTAEGGPQDALPRILSLFEDVFALITIVVRRATQVIGFIWKHFGDELIDLARIAWNLISGVISGVLDIIQGIVRTATAVLEGDWSAAWEGIKQITSGAWNIIKSLFSAGFDVVKLLVRVAWIVIKGLFTTGANAAKDVVESAIDKIVDFFAGIPGHIRSALSGLADIIAGPFKAGFDAVKSAWDNTIGRLDFSVPSLPSFGGFDLSRFPGMHTGGIVSGHGDQIRRLEGGEGVFTRDQMAAIGVGMTTGTAAPSSVKVVIDPSNLDRSLEEWIRRAVRVQGGGDVQRAFGQRR